MLKINAADWWCHVSIWFNEMIATNYRHSGTINRLNDKHNVSRDKSRYNVRLASSNYQQLLYTSVQNS